MKSHKAPKLRQANTEKSRPPWGGAVGFFSSQTKPMKVFLTLFIPAWVIGATISAMGLLEFSTHFTEMHACGASQPQAGRGVIINDSSVSAKVGFPTISPYNASKHCIASLTKVAALERATAQRNGRELDMDCCSMYTLREGKIAELHVLPFDAARWNEFWS